MPVAWHWGDTLRVVGFLNEVIDTMRDFQDASFHEPKVRNDDVTDGSVVVSDDSALRHAIRRALAERASCGDHLWNAPIAAHDSHI